jgi:hypothetical protein
MYDSIGLKMMCMRQKNIGISETKQDYMKYNNFPNMSSVGRENKWKGNVMVEPCCCLKQY